MALIFAVWNKLLTSQLLVISKSHLQISKKRDIKLADLGLANYKDTITGTMCGTILYMAPEVYEGKSYCTKVDIYSFGLIMWEMWFGERVFSELKSLTPYEIRGRIMQENYRPQTLGRDGRFKGNPPPAKWTELMASCWQTDPSLRPTAIECKDRLHQEIYVK